MKILHTRAAAEPILLVTTCHNMNLFAVITRSLIAVYRSTTLTLVTNHPLPARDGEAALCACWSPSGRLLSVGLRSGELLVLDVEGGDLVRRFLPRHASAPATHAASTPDEETSEASTDPLRRPPTLPVSLDGALVACTWATPIQAPSHPNHPIARASSCGPSPPPPAPSPVLVAEQPLCAFCLPPPLAVSSAVLDEAGRGESTPVLLLLDERGGLCLVPGGLREVCVVRLRVPFPLSPSRVRVESFVALGDTVSLTLHRTTTDKSGHDTHGESFWSIDLRGAIAAAASRGMVDVCCMAEQCRVAGAAYADGRRRWANVRQRVREVLHLPKEAVLLRDALVADLANPSAVSLRQYMKSVDAAAIVTESEEMTRQLGRLALQLTRVAERCYDAALHVAQQNGSEFLFENDSPMRGRCRRAAESAEMDHKSSGRQRFAKAAESATAARPYRQRWPLVDAIATLRQRCVTLLRRARLEAERERELMLWVARQASGVGDQSVHNTVNGETGESRAMPLITATPALPAARHPELLRTLHAIIHEGSGNNRQTSYSAHYGRRGDDLPRRVEENEEENEEEEEASLEQIVVTCLLHGREAVAHAVPHTALQWELAAEENGTEAVEVVDNERDHEGRNGREHDDAIWDEEGGYEDDDGGDKRGCVLAYALRRVGGALLAVDMYKLCGGKSVVSLGEVWQLDISPLRLTDGATPLWGGLVDDEGRRALMFEKDAGLLVALIGENGEIELCTEEEEEEEKGEEKGGVGVGAKGVKGQQEGTFKRREEENGEKYAVLEIKGMALRHLRVSVSRGRGFGVFYAKERFVVVDFYAD